MFSALVRLAFAGLTVSPPPSASRFTAGDVRFHLAAGGGGLLAAPAKAGLLWAEKEGGLYVSRLSVHPDHRRKGLATILLAAADAEARRRGLPFMWLSTRLALTGNLQLFTDCGFVERERHAHPGFNVPTFVDMVKTCGMQQN